MLNMSFNQFCQAAQATPLVCGEHKGEDMSSHRPTPVFSTDAKKHTSCNQLAPHKLAL